MHKFISFEGLDGGGKSSHVAAVVSWLTAQGREVVQTREPGGTSLGERLRHLMLNEPMSANTETLLAYAARAEHLAQVIVPALAADKIVISDRFADSSFAFQGGGRGIGIEAVRDLDKWCGGPRPTLTFLFDIPPAIAASRIEKTRAKDRFEAEHAEFHERVRQAYRSLVQENPQRFHVLDATQPMEAIRESILQKLASCFS